MRSLEKGTFHTAVLKTWPLELRTKSPQVPVYTEDIVYFGSSESRFFFSKLGSNMKLGLKYALEERKGQANGSSSPREKFSSFPDFITPLTAIES